MISVYSGDAPRVQQLAYSYLRFFKNSLSLQNWDCALRDSVTLNPNRARQIGAWYDAAPAYDGCNLTDMAYMQFRLEVNLQYDWAQSTGFRFEHVADNPYQDSDSPSQSMAHDVEANATLKVYSGGNRHPVLGINSPETNLSANDKFRAVHDLFGHALEGNTFGPLGEERAWLAHAKLFGPLALPALTTETRGQNSWVNYGPHMFDNDGWRGSKDHPRFLPAADRPFAEQKVVTLPPRFFDPSVSV